MTGRPQQLISPILLAGLLSLPALAQTETVEEIFAHFGSGEPKRQRVTIEVTNAVLAQNSNS